jgi:hypothetical protein
VLRAALLLPVLVLSLAACGGDDGGEAAATTAAAGDGAELRGSVGPGFDISLSGTDGLEPGTYTLAVSDLASSHNFHLTGPGGVDVATSVGGEGEESFEVTLGPGRYTFLCDPHSAQMRGTFRVAEPYR